MNAMAFIIAPIVTALIEIIKATEKVDPRYLPLTSLLVGGLVGAFGYFLTDSLTPLASIAAGFLGGLAATGFYELGSETMKGAIKK